MQRFLFFGVLAALVTVSNGEMEQSLRGSDKTVSVIVPTGPFTLFPCLTIL